jgi:tetratricopeptide (TPR) repeat protein
VEIRNFHRKLQEHKAKAEADPTDKAPREAFHKVRAELVAYETAEFERRIAAQPLKADFRNRLGELYFSAQRYDDAIAQLQAAAKDPKYRLTALTQLGRAFLELGQPDMAITQFRKAREGQELFAKIREPLYYEGVALERKGDEASLREALAVFTKLFEVDINFRDVKSKVTALQAKVQ